MTQGDGRLKPGVDLGHAGDGGIGRHFLGLAAAALVVAEEVVILEIMAVEVVQAVC